MNRGAAPAARLTPRLSPLWHLPRSLSRQGVIVISDTEHFNKTVDEAKAAGKKCVVDFTATWCGPCKMIKRTCAASEGCCQGLWHPLSDVTAASSCGRRAWCLPAGGG